MGTCTCVLPARLHLSPAGVHLVDGTVASVALVDEVWADVLPACTVCGASIEDTFYRCVPCQAAICRTCLGAGTAVVECDCEVEIALTGVQLAARRAAAAQAR